MKDSLENQQMKKEFAAILSIERRMKMKEANPHYFGMREQVKERLNAFVFNQPFGQLNKFQLLKLCHMIYLYNPVPFHNFGMKCGQELEDIAAAKAEQS